MEGALIELGRLNQGQQSFLVGIWQAAGAKWVPRIKGIMVISRSGRLWRV